MKAIWTLKNIFKNYRALLAILALEYVLNFTQIKEQTLPQIILKIVNLFEAREDTSELIFDLSKILFQEFTFIVLVICIFSGVLMLHKNTINNEIVNMGNFVQGIENNWKKVFIAGCYLIFSIGILKEIAQELIMSIMKSGDIKVLYLNQAIIDSLSLFFISIIIYGALQLIETKIRVGSFFLKTIKFIFSMESLKLYLIILLLSALYHPINILKSHYLIRISSLLNSRSLFSVFDLINTSNRLPIWLNLVESLAKTIIISFIILYTCLIFYWNKRKSELLNPIVK